MRTFDLILPDRLPQRAIEGVVLRRDGQPMPRAVVTILDFSGTVIARGIADEQGRFSLQVFAGLPYRLHALGPGNSAGEAVSAAQDIQPGGDPLSLRLTLAPPGNSMLDERRGGAERRP